MNRIEASPFRKRLVKLSAASTALAVLWLANVINDGGPSTVNDHPTVPVPTATETTPITENGVIINQLEVSIAGPINQTPSPGDIERIRNTMADFLSNNPTGFDLATFDHNNQINNILIITRSPNNGGVLVEVNVPPHVVLNPGYNVFKFAEELSTDKRVRSVTPVGYTKTQ